MPESITKVQRWLDLIAYLVGRRIPVAVEELMERLPAYARDWVEGDERAKASVRRKFERDKDELRSLGIPLETVTYTINYGLEEIQGYQIRGKDFYLPYLRLLKQEVVGARGAPQGLPPDQGKDRGRGLLARRRRLEGPASLEQTAPSDEASLGEEAGLFRLASDGSMEIQEEVAGDIVWGLKEMADLPGFPLAPAARSAFRKFTFDLDPVEVSKERVLYAIPPETARAEEHLEALSDALLRRKKVSFSYHGIRRDHRTEREVRPYGLLFKHSHWYLVAWDETRDAERIFRVDRMEGVRVNPQGPATPDYEMPPEPVLNAYRDRQAWEMGEEEEAVTAVVRFRFPISLWAARNGYGVPVEEGEEGATLRRFEIRQPTPFLRWILSLEGEAVIESPPELKTALREMAKEVAALYREDGDA
jgi:predicted DNA-binding transcriptional regulator YafY